MLVNLFEEKKKEFPETHYNYVWEHTELLEGRSVLRGPGVPFPFSHYQLSHYIIMAAPKWKNKPK